MPGFTPITGRISTLAVLLAACALIAACGGERRAPPAPPTEPADPLALPQSPMSEHLYRSEVHADRALLALEHAGVALSAPYSGRHEPDFPHHSGWPFPANRERYAAFDDNPVRETLRDPVTTFSIDVDTAAYSHLRRALSQGQTPHPDAIRTEELLNYFHYDYPAPRGREQPFAVHVEVGPSPWQAGNQLLRIGLKGWERATAELPPANLVFLIDVSGSMQGPDRIELVRASLKLLAGQLRPQDRVSIAVYAGAAGLVLEPTPGDQQARILAALDALEAGGSTNGGAGIQLAHALARQAYIAGGINRVILATDGDFNVGVVDGRQLEQLVRRERDAGIGLTVLGFGIGNYHDALAQQLAQAGNGTAAYIDTLNEARKVLVDELASTLETIARDVKIQLEFNPAVVGAYRLIGYETRHLNRVDFANDRVAAGDIGAGHTVTALYELTPVSAAGSLLAPLRYGAGTGFEPAAAPGAAHADELGFLRLRFKLPGETASRLLEQPIPSAAAHAALAATSPDFRFVAAVAGFGQLLRGGRYTGDFDYADVLALARESRGDDPFGYRGEFIGLVGTAAALAGQPVANR